MSYEGKPYQRIAEEIATLVTEKQAAYGNSFGKAGEILRILYPNGISWEQMDDSLTITRILDKLFRIATRKDAFGENPWRDVNGYTLLAIKRDEDALRGVRLREVIREAEGVDREPVADDHETHLREHVEMLERDRKPTDFSYRPSDVHLFSVTEEAPGAPSTCPDVEPVITRNETPKTGWCRYTVTPAPRFTGPNNSVCPCSVCTEVFSRCSRG